LQDGCINQDSVESEIIEHYAIFEQLVTRYFFVLPPTLVPASKRGYLQRLINVSLRTKTPICVKTPIA